MKHIGEVLRLMKGNDLSYKDCVMMVIGCMLIIVIHVVEGFYFAFICVTRESLELLLEDKQV